MKHQARKRFGQNFLTDSQVIDRIVHAMRLRADDNVIEVGPGLGALTLPLASQLTSLTVIEIDRDLIQRLEVRQMPNLAIIGQDVLKVEFNDFVKLGQPIRVVGNLPYNIGTPLLFRLLKSHKHLRDIHVMLQKEVVDRLAAVSGTRSYGRLSVMMQSVFNVEPLFDVPATAFEPMPKVESAVVRLTPIDTAPNDAVLETLERVTRMAFANKRKTLRNNLKKVLSESDLLELGINPQNRAETLTLETFHRLSNRLSPP